MQHKQNYINNNNENRNNKHRSTIKELIRAHQKHFSLYQLQQNREERK